VKGEWWGAYLVVLLEILLVGKRVFLLADPMVKMMAIDRVVSMDF
jgi:hypothetical protein